MALAGLSDRQPVDWAPLVTYLEEAMGYVVPEAKHYLLDRACAPLLGQLQVDSADGLVRAAQRSPEILQSVINAVTVNESLFFRDRNLWTDLPERLLPELVQEVTFKRNLDILLCACSTGQEVYTLAMMLAEHAEVLQGCSYRIIAADIDTDVMERAKAGIYTPFEVGRGLEENRLARFFDRVDGGYQAKRELLKNVTFQHLNLARDFTFAKRFDLVFCRNVLIYFDVPGKQRVLERLAKVTNNYGALVLGGAETTWNVTDLWSQRRMGKTTFYQKVY